MQTINEKDIKILRIKEKRYRTGLLLTLRENEKVKKQNSPHAKIICKKKK